MSVENELEELKELADTLGVKYHPSIGLENLRAKLDEADTAPKPDPEDGEEEEDFPPIAATAKATPKQINEAKGKTVKEKALKLVRIRIACMNPNKVGYTGELFSTGNRYTGRIKKFVPYDTDWHVPYMLLKMIQGKQCQVFVKKKIRTDSGAMVETTQGKLIREYAVEILPDLTKEELDALAKRQLAARGTEAA